MIKRLLVIATLGVMLSGCFVAPIAFIGPAVSGFNTASIMQASISTGANYMVKKTTGRSVSEHAIDAILGDHAKSALQQTYFPKNENKKVKNLSLSQSQLVKNK